MTRTVQLIPLLPFPMVQPGDSVSRLVLDCLQQRDLPLRAGDVLVVAQKICSKAENRYVRLADVDVSREARALAARADKDPALVQLILEESSEVLRVRPGAIIVEHRLGYVHANAGIDRSNIPSEEEQVLLLPENPDASAAELRSALEAEFEPGIAVIVNDSAGRAWRNGTLGFALGSSGLEPVEDQVGMPDLYGRPLEITEVAVADEMAAAASLVMGQADQACPVVLLRGANWRPSNAGSAGLLRDRAADMFR